MINKLVKAISSKSEKDGLHILLGMDEVTPDSDGYDYDEVDFNNQTNVDVFAVINPAGTSCRRDYQIKISKHENVHVERLDTRYRNSLQIALFLGHLNQYYILKPKLYEQHLKHLENLDYKVQQYKCINMSQDIPLSSTYLAEGMHIF